MLLQGGRDIKGSWTDLQRQRTQLVNIFVEMQKRTEEEIGIQHVSDTGSNQYLIYTVNITVQVCLGTWYQKLCLQKGFQS